MDEISIEGTEKQTENDYNFNKSNNEESIIKTTSVNDLKLIKNEVKSDDNIIEDNINKVSKKKLPTQKRKLYKYVGRTLFLFLDKYGNPIFIIGPHWPVFICFITLISSIMLFLYLKYWTVFGFKIKLSGYIIFGTFILSYIYTSLFNPGYPRNTIGRTFGIPKNDYYYCEYCGFYLRKCSYGSHCDICQICIEKHEHHCVWTGHCIGKNNKITFYIFLISIFSLLIYYGYAFYKGLSLTLKK